MDSSVLCIVIFVGILFLLGFIAWLLDSFANLTESKKKFRQLLENENKTKELSERLNKREQEFETESTQKSNELTRRSKELAQKSDKLDKEIAHYNALISGNDKVIEEKCASYKKKLENDIAYYNSLITGFDKVIEQKCAYYPQLAAIVADIETVFYERSAQYLETKKTPAKVEASRIRELRRQTRRILAEKKASDYRLEYIKTMFPNIEDIFDNDFAAPEDFELETDETTDRTRNFLSHEEYASLSTTERNQLALDRYLESRKSKWQVGRDYELYIGYQYECHGYTVKYTGIIENFEDMGRDLIAQKGNKVLIIQCKNWSQEKTIHEKHIFQLFGTLILYQLENPTLKSSALFVTTTSLSEKAKGIAKHLNISVRENIALCDFPRIKCNINRQSGEKIYHLPFDQQYDTVVIEKDKGEFMAFTVAEAENAGFRRAFKHFASQ